MRHWFKTNLFTRGTIDIEYDSFPNQVFQATRFHFLLLPVKDRVGFYESIYVNNITLNFISQLYIPSLFLDTALAHLNNLASAV